LRFGIFDFQITKGTLFAFAPFAGGFLFGHGQAGYQDQAKLEQTLTKLSQPPASTVFAASLFHGITALPLAFGSDTPSNFAIVGATSIERTCWSFVPAFTPHPLAMNEKRGSM